MDIIMSRHPEYTHETTKNGGVEIIISVLKNKYADSKCVELALKNMISMSSYNEELRSYCESMKCDLVLKSILKSV